MKLNPELTKRIASKLEVLEIHPGINVIIGPNGSGKSTILRGLYSQKATPEPGTPPFGLRYLDTEKMNPRIQSHLGDAMMGGVDTSSVIIGSRFLSHGQALGPILLAWGEGVKKGQHVILVDEPEAGTDLDAKRAILRSYREAPPRFRFLIATHDVMFLREASHVIELEPDYAFRLRAVYC